MRRILKFHEVFSRSFHVDHLGLVLAVRALPREAVAATEAAARAATSAVRSAHIGLFSSASNVPVSE